MFLQDLWRENVDWDEIFLSKLSAVWLKWSKEVAMLDAFPRFLAVGAEGPYQQPDLYIFSDASESAYGAAPYFRRVDARGTMQTIVLIAKARAAPLKPVRMGLRSALLAPRTYET
ncbi:hypothetical protein HPB50_001951 [Hyalomma asiaticum]|uniref:Uncharacterized protein n=1 Tax=Hyalomma asiaticum TaxID=266040 RepID=A0ACB7RNN3_HYAAI|nr:hypothetical protein HPB50_001951 [Hyalomma asiaticum]